GRRGVIAPPHGRHSPYEAARITPARSALSPEANDLSIIEGFRLLDALDILIIATLLYQGYILLFGSRAWNVLRGIFGLAAIWFIAVQFRLELTRWLFDAVAPVGFIALVVVFQPELRAVLER